jgi:transposase
LHGRRRPARLNQVENHTQKKTKRYKERNEQRREEFINIISELPKEQVVYVDETGIDEFLYREYARAPRGEVVYGTVSGKKFKRVGIVAARCRGEILAPLEYEGTMKSDLFEYWVEHILLPELPSNTVIVMDNASFHRKNTLHTIVKKFDCSLLFLPPYSPDLNPVEIFWAWLKQKLRALLLAYDDFDTALSACFNIG